jgi:hypothetical protein
MSQPVLVLPDIADLLRASVAALRTEALAAPAAVARWHPAPGEWCVNDVLGHLIEAERRGFSGRIRQLLAEREPALAGWDPDAVSRARGDCARPTRDLVDELAAMREDGVALLAALAPNDLARGGLHPKVGRLTVSDLLHEWVHHDRNHLRQVLANVQACVWPAMGNAQRFSAP